MTTDFDAFCTQHDVTPAERVDLAHHLAAMRSRRTLDACLYRPGRTLPTDNARSTRKTP